MSNYDHMSRTALPDELDLLRAFFDASIDFVYVKDLDGKYLAMNAAGARSLTTDTTSSSWLFSRTARTNHSGATPSTDITDGVLKLMQAAAGTSLSSDNKKL